MRTFFAILLFIVSTATTVPGAADPPEGPAAIRDVEQTLELWRAGDAGAVWDRCVQSRGTTKEEFVALLSSAPRRPACCWEKLRSPKAFADGRAKMSVRGSFGLDSATGTETATRSVKLVHHEGIWKMYAADIVSLSGGKKTKVRGGNHGKKKKS